MCLLRLVWKKPRFYALLRAVRDYETYANHLIKHNGRLSAAKVLKEAYAVGKRIALRCPPSDFKYVIWVRTAPGTHLPYKLRRIIPFLMANSLASRRLGLTVLSAFRLIDHGVKGSYRSQLDPYDGGDIPSKGLLKSIKFLKRRFKMFRFKVRKNCDPRSFWIGTAGVKGGRASLSSDYDAFCLLKPIFSDQLQATLSLAKRWIPKPEFRTWLGTVSMISIQPILRRVREDIAKHIFISEGGAKVRGVTPVNGIIQAVLYPYHEFFMTLLRSIPMDCSFDEAKGIRSVKEWTARRLPIYSFDLTDATDRFPIEALKLVFSSFFDGEETESWLTLMRIPIRFGRRKGSFFRRPFSVGAPMGIYCLWPVFTFCHHAIIQMAAYDVGYRGLFKLYVVRGDDVSLADEKVALRYEELMLSLGVKISSSKSFRSDVDGPGIAEFAKQLFYHGSVVSPLSLKALRAAKAYDPFSAISVIADVSGLFQKGRVPLPAGAGSPDLVLSWFIRKSSIRVIRTWLQFGWNDNVRSLLPCYCLPEPTEWTLLPGTDLILRIASGVLISDLIKDLRKYSSTFRERVLTNNVDAFHRPWITRIIDDVHPFFRALKSLENDLKEIKDDHTMFCDRPNARVSRTLHLHRSIRGLGSATLISRRHVRYLTVSKYFERVEDIAQAFIW